MTSLAEQQLFGIRKCIIPLPFTGGNHQRHNAQRCVSHRNDTLVEQDTKLARNLEEYLIRHVGYKKELYTPDAQMVTAPLQTIWSTLLPHH